jgi:hypothetical protein
VLTSISPVYVYVYAYVYVRVRKTRIDFVKEAFLRVCHRRLSDSAIRRPKISHGCTFLIALIVMPHSMSCTAVFEVRRASKEECQTIFEWEVKEGWNPGKTDIDSFYAADNDGFFIGYLNNEPISCISVVRHGDNYAFVGSYIVKPGFRGNGFGLKTWKHALSSVAGYANVGLDAVLEREGTYAKEGFKTVHRHVRYRGDNVLVPSDNKEDPCLVDANTIPFGQLLAYDKIVFPGVRSEFLKTWIRMPGTVALAYVKEGVLKGFGVIRPAIEGWKIAPLFADNEDIANAIFGALAKHACTDGARAAVYLDVPDVNKWAVKLAKNRGMTSSFECARMYTNGKPEGLQDNKIYGVATLEVG